MFVLFVLAVLSLGIAQKRQVIIDADTGNEVDDLYALVRVLLEPSLEVTAINAAHWQTSHWTIPKSMENSHRLNQQLLGEMGLAIPTKRGATARMYDWGDRAQHSAAAYEIVAQAREAEKVEIVVLGALTNVASAVFIAPEIAEKLKIYWLGTTMDFDTKVLKRNDFNPLMDPFALDYLLESEVEMHIMPVNVASAMRVTFEEVQQKTGTHFLGNFLLERWKTHIDGDRRARTLWDLALVAAFIHPELAQTVTITTSRDSGQRPITFYKEINPKGIYQDFYKVLLAFKAD